MAKWINDGLHETSGVIHSFLLAGQSNMAGRGDGLHFDTPSLRAFGLRYLDALDSLQGPEAPR